MHIREATVILEDGVELTRSFHRKVIEPDSDVTSELQELKSISTVVHTPTVKQKWADKKVADKAKKPKEAKVV